MISKKFLNFKNSFNYVVFTKNNIKKGNKYIVPNVSAIAREMTSSSQILMIIKRFLSLSFTNKIKLGFNNLKFVFSLLKKDFATGVKILCELEILKICEKFNINHFVLHNQMVDMAVAFNNKNLFKNFLFLSKKYNFTPGIITYNIEATLKYLSNISGIPDDLIIYTPLDQIKNFSVLEYFKKSNLTVVDIKN